MAMLLLGNHQNPKLQTQPQDEEPMSPTLSTSSSQDIEMEEELSSAKEPSSSAPAPAPAPNAAALSSPASSSIKKSVSLPSALESCSSQPASNIVDVKLIESAPTKVVISPMKPTGAKSMPTPEEMVMEEAIWVNRGRLRKTKSTTANKYILHATLLISLY